MQPGLCTQSSRSLKLKLGSALLCCNKNSGGDPPKKAFAENQAEANVIPKKSSMSSMALQLATCIPSQVPHAMGINLAICRRRLGVKEETPE